MITRRKLCAVSAAAVLSQNSAVAQVRGRVPPPKPEEVVNAFKDNEQFRRILLGTDALRLLLILRLIQMRMPSTGPNRDLGQWFEVRNPFDSPAFVMQLQDTINKIDSIRIIELAGENVGPTCAGIESALAEGGLAPNGQLAIEMIRSFYIFVQIRAVVERKAVSAGDSWYCSVYPFSRFCKSA